MSFKKLKKSLKYRASSLSNAMVLNVTDLKNKIKMERHTLARAARIVAALQPGCEEMKRE